MAVGRLRKSQRDEVPVMSAFARDIKRQLESQAFDDAIPSLEPALEEARKHAAFLEHWLEEIKFLVEEEHSKDRSGRPPKD